MFKKQNYKYLVLLLLLLVTSTALIYSFNEDYNLTFYVDNVKVIYNIGLKSVLFKGINF